MNTTITQEQIIGLNNTAALLESMLSSYPAVTPIPKSNAPNLTSKATPVLNAINSNQIDTNLALATNTGDINSKTMKIKRFERPLGFDVASLTRASETNENLETTDYDLAPEDGNDEIDDNGDAVDNNYDDFSE